ncbi:MAG: porin family protein [Acidobacteria bacterium]|nr:porin family protein [Acidobacteriota bacterium]
MTRLGCLAVLAAARCAQAQPFEAGLFGGVSRINRSDIGSFSVGDVTRISLKDGWCFGGRMTFNSWPYFGHEVGYKYNRTQWQLSEGNFGSAIHQGFYNFLASATPEGSRVRPFATGGAHFTNFIFPGQSVTQGGGSNKVGVNYGGGIKVKVSPKYMIRLDMRQYIQGKPYDLPNQSGRLTLLEISAGFSFHL